ncbi:glycosyltransferase [Solidesulfovibrio magneticus]|uniref:Glycosyltransferase n=1 Tax=Solidesulfovibrio magneticus (strain ATCC 700980 / DSM 13731 / RS-1) TaxID=573370 RepID=C4XMS1_SOLM1|nr:glycosyltransferase [Solidesulfovibrio magneticus]BAH74862.1 putative glycosyltransferase [Solidesulfovibrio magneticus RS-1]
MTDPCAGLPGPLCRLLAVGGSGAGLIPLRDAALAAGPAQAALTSALALAAWAETPLDPAAAAVAARLGGDSPQTRAAAAVAVAAKSAGPEPYYERLAGRRDTGRMAAYLLERCRKEPGEPTWLARLARIAPMLPAGDDLAEAEGQLAAAPGLLAVPGAMAAGELALLAGRAEAAEAHLRRALAQLPTSAAWFRLAEALLAQGRRGETQAAYAAARDFRPWDRLLAGRAADVAAGRDMALARLPGRLAVLIYCWNSPDLLAQALDALAASDWRYAPQARVVVLDNGSPDGVVSAVAAARTEGLGGRLTTVRLPVNVGAPAARNWLAALPEVRERDFVAYLDDDAFVPPDWLGRFGAAVAATPGAGVWGCRVVAKEAPRFVQCGDAHLLPTPRAEGTFGRGFELARPWLAAPDWGQFRLSRPCASVTGCCHLFARPTLDVVGGFDIRFSPTQYDDLDHDLRLLLRREVPQYWGHLTVVHAKTTGAAGQPGGSAWGNGFANQVKLHGKYEDDALAVASDAAFAALAADRQEKAARLDPGAGEGGRG